MDTDAVTEDSREAEPADIPDEAPESRDADEGSTAAERPPTADAAEADDDGATAPAPEAPAPEAPARKKSRGLADARSYMKRHPRGTAVLVLVSLIAVALLARAWRRSNNLPDLAFIEQDAGERIEAPIYSGGSFGSDDSLILTQVTVGARQHSDRAPEGAELEETFAATSYATADVMVNYQNESVIATKTATLGYARQNQAWIDAGVVSNEQISFLATRGVDQKKVLHNIGQVLEQAGSAIPARKGTPSLAELYEGASFEVTSSTFDDGAQTDTLTIHARRGGRFSSYECDIVATFAFMQDKGLWELSEAHVTDDAWVRRFDPLLGTWEGTFESQTVSSGATCLAGGSTPFSLTIISWADTGSGARISGTLSAVAHFHRSPETDSDAAEGDAVLEAVPFTATLYEPEDTQLEGEATFIATLPETVGGTVSLTLVFGSAEDEAAVRATVTTEYSFEDTFILVPYQNKVIYADTYGLALVQPVSTGSPEEEGTAGEAGQGGGAGEAEPPETAGQPQS